MEDAEESVRVGIASLKGASPAAPSHDLRITAFSLKDFRSYEYFGLDEVGPLTVFIGPNGSGKTNAVEGIQSLTAYGSFRGATSRELIRWGARSATLQANLRSDARSLDVCCEIHPGQRSCALNAKKKSVQDMQGVLPSVVFSPDDLTLIKGPQSRRRATLDLLGCQLSRSYRILKRDYDRMVRHKNALLKDGGDPLVLASVGELMTKPAVQLYLYRIALFRNLTRRMQDTYTLLTRGQERLEAGYVPSWEDGAMREAAAAAPLNLERSKNEAKELFERACVARAPEELARRRTCVGPHADRLEFFIDGKNASVFASQGQQRSFVLAWKIAEVSLVRERMGTSPVLLLDDVMSELDPVRRATLVGLLDNHTQTFITATETALFEDALMERARIVELG